MTDENVPLNDAIEAMAHLIAHTISGKESGRFTRAASLCQLAHGVLRAHANRVDEFAQLDNGNEYGMGAIPVMGGYNVHRRNPVNFGGPADAEENARNAALLTGPLLQVSTETARATCATQETTELATLVGLRDKVKPEELDIIERRILTLLIHTEARRADLATTDLSRGYQTDANAGGDEPQGVRDDANRGEGHGGLAVACHAGDLAVGQV